MEQAYRRTPQHKIDSGFGLRSTAAQVLAGIDLSGKLALVTGGYSGLGLETTKALVNAGARVIVPARRPEAAEEALSGIANVEVGRLDLSDLGSVKDFAEKMLERGASIDLAILNAGVMASPETRVGPGWELQFATNHLGHFALINRLWPLLTAGEGARVVATSSTGHHFSPIRWDNLNFEGNYRKFEAYGQSKTANSLFAVELDRRGAEQGVRAFAAHPGGILTPLQRHLSREEMVELKWVDEEGNGINPGFKTPEQGAATQVWAATSPQLAGKGGVYCEDCDIAEPAPEDGPRVGVKDYAVDPEEAKRLWELSERLTGTSGA
ncbi:SDR family NAD(P)-dependent oxidoreductase [Saccharibacillus sp. CPCC 101409]|uniref:SDR family NAD(P)-dependent oxidoreductase n=1 Tax=Saccharibacillus sp. CPCC 101409 TaxID=3058041 RepID=UPI002671979C|nr:SDR family NAD(P)-dependent oxidoreductase [Saccharibacillus sp. CPCC 101409]MDO3410402.1 SDR family NAD(P)-dependent oxidoreductase [Saccharibacillus sp. CPCC 101409]